MVGIPPIVFTVATPVLQPSQFTCVTLTGGITAETALGSTTSNEVVNTQELT